MGAVQNYVNVSRRPPDIEDYIDIMRRYRSWIIGPMFAGLVVSVVVAFIWPDTYRSVAVMRIAPQTVSTTLIPADANSRMFERLSQMQQEILSRGSLSAIILQPALDLYKKERQQKPIEDIVQDMRTRDIHIYPLEVPGSNGRMASAFGISFQYIDKYKAQAVVRELVTKFMESNAMFSRNTTKLTTTFLDDELKAAKDHLDELSTKITKFRSDNSGRLPEQTQANVATLNSYQMQVGQFNDAVSRLQATKLQLETTLQGLNSDVTFYSSRAEQFQIIPGQPGSAPLSVKNERLVELDRQLIKSRGELAALQKQYKDGYPIIGAVKAQIEQLQSQYDEAMKEQATQQLALNAAAPAATGPTQVRVPDPVVQQHLQDLKNQIAQVKTNITNTDMEIESKNRSIAELNRKIADYQARIDASPLSEQEYARLMGDYTLAKTEYDDKIKKRDQSLTMQNLEEHKAGESLEVLDPPNLPEQSFEPNRAAWVGIGTVMGLVVGVMLAAAKEVKNTSLKNLKDVRAYTNLPVLSSIPLLENALLVRRKRRLFWLVWSSAFIVGSIAMSGAMYYHFFGKS
jgi:polysaccharide chain length determinant protein (PEP-CTERM system associated)